MLRKIVLAVLGFVLISTSVSFAKTPVTISLSSDKAMYSPSETVTVAVKTTGIPSTEKLSYQIWHLETLVKRGTVQSGKELIWQAPASDYQGYLLSVYRPSDSNTVTYLGINVSSDWTKFPIYGFLSDFSVSDSTKRQRVIETLNRFHINGIQFYDWQDSHSQPLKVVDNQPLTSWHDINHRATLFEAVSHYISLAHSKNMRAMNYNLAYGSYQQDALDHPEWALYTDANHTQMAKYPLPGWESDLYLMNPANPDWQDYLFAQEKLVNDYLAFDGWHVDQLGSASYLDYNGNRVNLATAFASLLTRAKTVLGKELVMNAVDGYAQREIMQTNATDFQYTEVWGNSKNYSDLSLIIDYNHLRSTEALGKPQASVLAAYMNYNKANKPGYFNEPGVLLTNAAIFASGGSHLELGEHMLGKEYFPNSNLKMTVSLKANLQNYYDFLVAYENLLRDDYQPVPLIASIQGMESSLDTLSMPNTVWMFARSTSNKKVIHLINLLGQVDSQWRDTDGKRKPAVIKKNLQLSISSTAKVKSIYMATPDGKLTATKLAFSQKGRTVKVTVPELKYWDMLVLNY